jgi:hypothetical protein
MVHYMQGSCEVEGPTSQTKRQCLERFWLNNMRISTVEKVIGLLVSVDESWMHDGIVM